MVETILSTTELKYAREAFSFKDKKFVNYWTMKDNKFVDMECLSDICSRKPFLIVLLILLKV